MYKEGTIIEIKIYKNYRDFLVKEHPDLKKYIPPMSMDKKTAVVIGWDCEMYNLPIYDIEIIINGMKQKRKILGMFTKYFEKVLCPTYQPINKENEEKIIMNESIVKMWQQKTKDAYCKFANEMMKNYESIDRFLIKKKELEETMKSLLIENGFDKAITVDMKINSNKQCISEETRDKLNKLSTLYDEKLREIDNKAEEILAMIKDCNHYDQSINILRAYGIVDASGKLKIEVNKSALTS